MKSKYVIGTDVGGTKIKTGIIDIKGRLVGRTVRVTTDAHEPAGIIVGKMIESVRKVVRESNLSNEEIGGIGMGLPGPLDIKKGIILTPPNLKTLHGYNIKKAFKKAFKLPVYTNNDGNCFVLGESYFGAARGANIVFGVALGTGFGNGIVIDGRIFNGATGTAAENWISPYSNGTFEDCLSGKGVTAIYLRRGGKKLASKEIYDRARNGEKRALATWAEFGKHLGIALAYVTNVIDPAVIVIGGSLSKAYSYFIKEAQKSLKKNINPVPRENIRIVKAKLGDNAGMIGSACLVLENMIEAY